MRQPFEDDLALWAELGVAHVGVVSPKLQAAGWDAAPVVAAGLRVSSLSAFLEEEVDWSFMHAVGCDLLYTVSGGGATKPWEEAADEFSVRVAPWLSSATAAGVRVAVEPTNPLRSDVSFVHTVRDAAFLARKAGIGVVVDLYSCWYERGLAEVIAENIDLVSLVQIGDFKLGTLDMPNRVAIGDGDVPVERLLAVILEAGYEGPLELEIMGPRIEAEGYRAPITRSLERATAMLERLGV
jgi:sugar phosphate isomerase/epimerase